MAVFSDSKALKYGKMSPLEAIANRLLSSEPN